MKDFCYNPSDWTNQDQSHYCCLLLQLQIGNWALNCYIWLRKTVCERHNYANVWKTNLTWFMKDWFQTSVTFNFKIDGNIVGAQMWTVVERGRSLPSNATASRGIGRLCCLRNAVQKRMVKHHHLVHRYTLEIYSSLYNSTGWPSRIWPPNPARPHCYDLKNCASSMCYKRAQSWILSNRVEYPQRPTERHGHWQWDAAPCCQMLWQQSHCHQKWVPINLDNAITD